jgi:hydroxymethylpyrimidine pyrophosphatase-like HAD family hydrolase
MTGRIGAMSIDGTLVSQADIERMQAEEALHVQWQRKAARVVASSSRDLGDCREILAMLGLGHEVIAAARGSKPVRKRRAARPRAA